MQQTSNEKKKSGTICNLCDFKRECALELKEVTNRIAGDDTPTIKKHVMQTLKERSKCNVQRTIN